MEHGLLSVYMSQAVQSFMLVNTNSPHAPLFMCQPINNLQQKAVWGFKAELLILNLQIYETIQIFSNGNLCYGYVNWIRCL